MSDKNWYTGTLHAGIDFEQLNLPAKTAKDAITALANGYALQGVDVNLYLILHEDYLTIFKKVSDGFYAIDICTYFDLILLIKDGFTIHELKTR